MLYLSASILLLEALALMILIKDKMNPGMILTFVWLFVFAVLIIFNGTKNENSNYYLVIPLGNLAFICSFIISQKFYTKNIRSSYAYNISVKPFVIDIILIYELVILAIYLVAVLIFIKNNFIINIWYTIKFGMHQGEYIESNIVKYSRTFIYVFTDVIFIIFCKLDKASSQFKFIKRVVILQICISIVLSFFAGGRTFFFILFIPLFFIYVSIKKLSAVKLIKASFSFSFFLMAIFIIILLLKYTSATSEGGIAYTLNSIRAYIVSPTVLFTQWCDSRPELLYGTSSLRFFYAFWGSLNGDITSRIRNIPYVLYDGFYCNVFTVYKIYASDFGISYAILIQLILGLIHGIAYANAKNKKTVFSVYLYAFLMYPLILQFFDDEYLTLLSFWIQILIYGVILLKTKIILNANYSIFEEESL